MRSAFREKLRALQGLRKKSLPLWGRLVITLGVTLLYVVTFEPITASVGPVGTALITLPVVVAGWYFGMGAGIIASLLGIILSVTLLIANEGNDWVAWIIIGWPGYLMLIASGFFSGLLKNNRIDRDRIHEELRYRERFLSIINITTKEIVAPPKNKDAHYRLASHLVNLFTADYAYLTRWDETQEQVVLTAATKGLKQPFSEVVLEADEAALTTEAIQTGNILVIDDDLASRVCINPGPFKESGFKTRSALVIPLLAGQYKFGAVILAYDSPRHFTRQEITWAELAGNQVALALWAAQQNVKLQQRLREATALSNIEHMLSETEQVGLEKVLQVIVDSAKDLIPKTTHAVVHLLDDEQHILIPSAVSGYRDKPHQRLNMRLGEGIAGQAIAAREIFFIPDTLQDPRFLNPAVPGKARSLIVVPIQSNERCVGAISIQSRQPHAFTLEESQLLGALGTQAAIAIENSSLLETTRRDLKEIHALYQISQHLVASLEPDRLMKDVVDLLAQSFGYYHVQIFVIDPDSGDLVLRQGSGEIGRRLKEAGHRLPFGAGIIGHTAETGEPFVTNDVDQVIFFMREPLLQDTMSELTIPIKVENKVLGVLDIQHTPPGRLSRRDLQLMSAVADQLAVALQKASLYTDLQESLHQEQETRAQLIHSEKLAVAGRLLATVSHELNNPLQAIQNALYLLKEEKGISVLGHQDLEIVLSEAERMATMLERLRATYLPARLEDFRPVAVNTLIEDVHTLLATHLRHAQIAYDFQADPDLPPVPGIVDQLRQVILNLFMNARDAMQSGGQMTVSTHWHAESHEVLISISDTGQGIEPALLPHIFEPFVTGKEDGTGLGLSISYDIIFRHGGRMQAENNPQGGATFQVWLPGGMGAKNDPPR